jgi:molecular chaperone DnaK
MKEEAEANADADRKAKEEVEKINQADSLIFQTERQLKEFGDKLPEDKKAPIEQALNKLREAHKNRDIAGIDSSMAELNNVWQAASEEIYKATQQAGQAGNAEQSQPGPEQGKGPDQEVTDVDFEEVK